MTRSGRPSLQTSGRRGLEAEKTGSGRLSLQTSGRAGWEALADALLAGVAPHQSADGATFHLPGPRPSGAGALSDGLEGFARTFLLAAFRVAGDDGPDRVPGDLVDRYGAGLVAGPLGAWTRPADVRQTMVEAASIAVALYETRSWLWDGLDGAERDRLAAWLLESCTDAEPYACNWVLFPVLVTMFLRSVGAPHVDGLVERNLDLVESWARPGGWYTDGAGRNFDHYAGWALHLYAALWCRMGGDDDDPPRAARLRQRLREFLGEYTLLFGGDGAPLHQGRSLVYRFAAVAAPWAGVLADATPLAPGATRTLATRCVQYFLDRGAVSRDGVLSMGWHGEFEPLAQLYSGPASPYWASKAFLGLLLPADHPEWTVADAEPAVDGDDFATSMQAPGWAVSATRADGIVRVANHGTDHHPLDDRYQWPHYRKLAYSTAAGPDLGTWAESDHLDNEIVLLDATGTQAPPRQRVHESFAGNAGRAGNDDDGGGGGGGGGGGVTGRSVWFPWELRRTTHASWSPWEQRVEVRSHLRGHREVRVAHVTSPEAVAVRAGGWAVAHEEPPTVSTGDRWAMATTAAGLTSFVGLVHGDDATVDVRRREGANPFGRHSATPFVTTPLTDDIERVLAVVVILSGVPVDPDEELAAVPQVTVAGDRRRVSIRYRDGARAAWELVG